jgi:hypothetical protein
MALARGQIVPAQREIGGILLANGPAALPGGGQVGHVGQYTESVMHRTRSAILIRRTVGIASLAALTLAEPAAAQPGWQWEVINLHPVGAEASWAFGVHEGQQVGQVLIDGVFRASLWTGSADSWIDLHPASATDSRGRGVDGGQQVGTARMNGVTRASLWAGSAGSWVDLHPGQATLSFAHAIHSGRQAGGATIDGVRRAALWTGNAGSWVDLHPTGATDSVAWGIHDDQQVGQTIFTIRTHASLWTGSAGSWVDLHPAGAGWSRAVSVHDGQQVGWAAIGGAAHASLWTGSAGSWVDLHPAGASTSDAHDVYAGRQVGRAKFDGVPERASLWWNGTPESWEALPLPPGSWSITIAESIWSDDTTIRIAGYGFNSDTNRREALLWEATWTDWHLLTVSDTNTLMRVDLSSGPNYTATAIGVTQDAPGGPVRRVRGLASVGTTLYGMTREGDLVEIDPNTAETTFKLSVAAGSDEFWSDLAYDATNNDLYTVLAFGDQSLVRIDLDTMMHTIQGPTEWIVDGSRRQMLGVEFMGGMLLGSNRQNQNIVEMNPADGSFDFTWGNSSSGVNNAQQIAVHPGTGVLWGIHDHFSSSNNAALSTFDAAFRSTEMGELPFGIVESAGGGNDTYGWGGIAFIPVAPCRVDLNEDGEVNTLDVLIFLNWWVAKDPRADWNGDAEIDTQDVLDFLSDWVAGCP